MAMTVGFFVVKLGGGVCPSGTCGWTPAGVEWLHRTGIELTALFIEWLVVR